MLNFLHGKWLNHPLHALLVSVPVGLWPSALIFDLLAAGEIGGAESSRALAATSFYAILLGLGVALLAIPAGLADWWDVGRDKPAWKIGLWHLLLNVVVVTIWTVNLALRWTMGETGRGVGAVPLILSVVGTLLLAGSAYLGGRMVYDYGTYVGWFELAKWRRIAESGGSNVPDED